MKAHIALSVTDVEVNVLAQRFYEASGITLPAMTDKPKIVAGLTFVLGQLGIEVVADTPTATPVVTPEPGPVHQ